jgi:hypothetical protein
MREPISTRQWIMAVTGVVLIALAGWMLLHRRAPRASVQPVRAANPSAVGLYVQHDGPALRLRWNPDTAAIRDAQGGVLSIVDGARQSRLELQPQDLRAGVASYWPESRDVTFRLTLDGDAAGEIRASADAPPEARPSPFDSGQTTREKTRVAARSAARSSADAESGEDDPPPPTIVNYFTVPAAPVGAHAVKAPSPAPRETESAAPPPRPVVAAPKPPAAVSAERQVEEAPEPKKESPSRWRRVTGKIPLLRRLGKH